MTLEYANGFFAWDVVSFLALFIVLALVVLLYDTFLRKNTLSTNKSVTLARRNWLHFLIYGRFYKTQSISHKPFIIRISAELFPILLLVFLIRGFLAEPFQIPSNSMMPTLLTGDFVFVNKMSYGIRIPITNTKLISTGEIKRGDPIVFRYPNYENNNDYKGIDFIKRVIGIPGDTIEYINDSLVINNQQIDYDTIGVFASDKRTARRENGYTIKTETLDNNTFSILTHPIKFSQRAKLIVPKGHYFVMGDNRNNSADSRFWGFVPNEYILGKAVFIWMNYDEGFNLDRIGSIN